MNDRQLVALMASIIWTGHVAEGNLPPKAERCVSDACDILTMVNQLAEDSELPECK